MLDFPASHLSELGGGVRHILRDHGWLIIPWIPMMYRLQIPMICGISQFPHLIGTFGLLQLVPFLTGSASRILSDTQKMVDLELDP